MSHVWVIEAKHLYSKDKNGEWHPMFGHLCFGSRKQAREEAKRLYTENKYNYAFVKNRTVFLPVVKYRTMKYKMED